MYEQNLNLLEERKQKQLIALNKEYDKTVLNINSTLDENGKSSSKQLKLTIDISTNPPISLSPISFSLV